MAEIEKVPEGWYGPDHFFVGSFARGRVVFDTAGRRLKVIRQGEGSTVVRRKGTPRTIKGRTFTPPETLTISPRSAVRLRKRKTAAPGSQPERGLGRRETTTRPENLAGSAP